MRKITLALGVAALIGAGGFYYAYEQAAQDYPAKILESILNTGWKFNVRLKRSGDFGPLQWDGLYYKQSVLLDIPQHSKVNIGDTVVTSGYSELFPQNIPIGVVQSYEIKRGNFCRSLCRPQKNTTREYRHFPLSR